MPINYVKEMTENGYGAEDIDSFHLISLPYLGERFFPDKSGPVLDLGIGAGHCALALKKAGWGKVYGFDRDDFQKGCLESQGVVFAKGDISADRLPYADDFFEAVVSFHVVEHLYDPDNYLKEIRRVLNPRGVAVVVTPDWRKQCRTFYRDPTHVHPYDKESIARLFRAHGFKSDVKSFGVLRGLGRTGLWKKVPQLMFTGIDMICISKKD